MVTVTPRIELFKSIESQSVRLLFGDTWGRNSTWSLFIHIMGFKCISLC